MDGKRKPQECYMAVRIMNSDSKSKTFWLEPLSRTYDLHPDEEINLVVGGPKEDSIIEVEHKGDYILVHLWTLNEIWVYKDRELIYVYPDSQIGDPPKYLGNRGARVIKTP